MKVLRIIGLLLAVFFGYFFYSLNTAPARMMEVCSQIKPGMTHAQLKTFAEEHGLSQPPKKESGATFLGESRSYGRFTCRVVLEAGVVKSSEYVHVG